MVGVGERDKERQQTGRKEEKAGGPDGRGEIRRVFVPEIQ